MIRIYAGTTGLCVTSPLMFGWWSIPLLAIGAVMAVAWWREAFPPHDPLSGEDVTR